jgi:hypothetical protein
LKYRASIKFSFNFVIAILVLLPIHCGHTLSSYTF